jgi:hypothetical protein
MLSAGMVALALGAGTIRPAPARAATGTYVALGDSYSAGTGAPAKVPPYYLDTDGCDRSASAWPETLGSDLGFSGPQFGFHACQGAVTADLTQTYKGEPPQESWLTPDTRLVTLSMGGNDVGFVRVLSDCIKYGYPLCQGLDGKQLDSDIANIKQTLVSVYKEIAHGVTVGTTTYSGAPNATIIVMGYPRWFPSSPPVACYTGADPLYVPFHFSDLEMSWMNDEIQNLDNQIQAAVTAAYHDPVQPVKNILYVNAYDAFNGHELCTADPYLNRVVNFNPATFSFDVSSFHPNLAGNQQMAGLALPTARAVLAGAAIIPVPNVVGLPATNAVSAIRSAGLVPIEYSQVDTLCNTIGYVINQSPQAGTPIATGFPVTITVGVKPPNPCP